MILNRRSLINTERLARKPVAKSIKHLLDSPQLSSIEDEESEPMMSYTQSFWTPIVSAGFLSCITGYCFVFHDVDTRRRQDCRSLAQSLGTANSF